MITEKTSREIKTLFSDEIFAGKFREIDEFSKAKKLFKDNGIEIDDNDLIKLLETMLKVAETNESDELNEEQMDSVTGGFVEWIVLGVAFGVVGGTSTYMLRKMVNSATGTCKK